MHMHYFITNNDKQVWNIAEDIKMTPKSKSQWVVVKLDSDKILKNISIIKGPQDNARKASLVSTFESFMINIQS